MPDLPEVSEDFVADVTRYVDALSVAIEAAQEFADANHEALASVAELQAGIDALHGKTVEINVETTGGGLGGLGLGGLSAEFNAMRRDIADISADLMMQTDLLREMAAAVGVIQRDTADTSADLMMQTALLREMRDLWAQSALAATMASAATRDAGAGAAAAGAGFRILGTGIRLTGTALHWIVAGTFEFLAVAIPAAVALGSGMMVAAQGAQNAQIHMSALYTATEATANIFHVTFGEALGLRGALQAAQDAANPGVYEVLGSVINDVRARFSDLANTGLQVVHMFDEFTARVTVDLQGALGGQIQGLLAGMTTDLLQFGQIIGNVGHAILNFASAMPGLAHVLLAIADGVSQVILAISSLPPWIITTVMAIEEFYRWGGLALRMVIALASAPAAFVRWLTGANFITAFGASLLTIIGALGRAAFAIGAFLAEAEVLPGVIQAAGAALAALGIELDAVATGLAPLTAAVIALAAAGLGFLMYKAATAGDAMDHFAASVRSAVQSASDLNVYSVIGTKIAETQVKMAAAQDTFNKAAQRGNAEMMGVAGRYLGMGAAAGSAAADLNTLHGVMGDLANTAGNVATNTVNLGHALHMSSGEALLFANAAGVKLTSAMSTSSMAFKVAVQEILNLEQGYRAMGASAGVVGKDMTAVAIQSGLQATKVQQLTQAWDNYIGLLTGGTSSLAGFELGLKNMTTGIATVQNNLSSLSGSMSISVGKFATDLQRFTGQGAQAWQNFNQVAGSSAQQFIDWMDNAAAVGMVKGSQLSGAIKGIVGQLIPFASHSQAARAELAGLAQEAGYAGGTSLKELQHWAQMGGMSARQLGQFVSETTTKLSDMAQVAANLGQVLQSDLVAAFDHARLQSSGFNSDLANLSNEIASRASPASQGYRNALQGVITSMAQLHVSVPEITAFVTSMGVHITAAGVQAVIAAGKTSSFASSASAAGQQAGAAAGHVNALAAAEAALHDKTITITTYMVTDQIFHGGSAGHPVRMQAGGFASYSGFHMVGEQGPEIRWLNAGDYISNAGETRQFMSGTSPSVPPSAMGGATRPIHLEATIHNHVEMDGQSVWESQQKRTLIYNVRNGNSGSGVVSPNISGARG